MLGIFLIGIALSMDAFSVALTLGLSKLSNLNKYILPLSISIMHFIMPLLGNILGDEVLSIINIDPKMLSVIVFIYLCIVMIFEEEKEYSTVNILSILIISFSVSVDSFSIGVGLSGLTNYKYLSYLLFALCSGSFTYLGLLIGKYSSKFLKNKARLIGILIIVFLIIVNICKILTI